MIHAFDCLRNISFLVVAIRLVSATICGGVIGIERSYKQRPAGFRTHILICLGAAMAMMTGIFILTELHQFTDIARLGAQVIAGMGFIGAGSIIVTKRKNVKGLTTAAGLWTAAIIGLACGAGFYELALFSTIVVLLAEVLFSKIEYRLMHDNTSLQLSIEYEHTSALNSILKYLNEQDLRILDLKIYKYSDEETSTHHHANVVLQLFRKILTSELIGDLLKIDGVFAVDEMSAADELEGRPNGEESSKIRHNTQGSK